MYQIYQKIVHSGIQGIASFFTILSYFLFSFSTPAIAECSIKERLNCKKQYSTHELACLSPLVDDKKICKDNLWEVYLGCKMECGDEVYDPRKASQQRLDDAQNRAKLSGSWRLDGVGRYHVDGNKNDDGRQTHTEDDPCHVCPLPPEKLKDFLIQPQRK